MKDKMQPIAQKQAKAAELRKELERSLAIQELWPGVFDGLDTKVSSFWRGDSRGIVMVVKRETPVAYATKVEHRGFKLSEVPECLYCTIPTELRVRVQESLRKAKMIARLAEGGE